MSFADERLVHLRAAGLLDNVKGIVFGQLSLDRSEEDEFEDFLLDLVSDLDVPVLMDFPAGHEVPNLTLRLEPKSSWSPKRRPAGSVTRKTLCLRPSRFRFKATWLSRRRQRKPSRRRSYS